MCGSAARRTLTSAYGSSRLRRHQHQNIMSEMHAMRAMEKMEKRTIAPSPICVTRGASAGSGGTAGAVAGAGSPAAGTPSQPVTYMHIAGLLVNGQTPRWLPGDSIAGALHVAAAWTKLECREARHAAALKQRATGDAHGTAAMRLDGTGADPQQGRRAGDRTCCRARSHSSPEDRNSTAALAASGSTATTPTLSAIPPGAPLRVASSANTRAPRGAATSARRVPAPAVAASPAVPAPGAVLFRKVHRSSRSEAVVELLRAAVWTGPPPAALPAEPSSKRLSWKVQLEKEAVASGRDVSTAAGSPPPRFANVHAAHACGGESVTPARVS